MTEFFSSLLNIATLVFAVSSMLSVGFSYTLRQIISPLRNARLVISTLVANFVLVPLLAYGITSVLSIGQGREIGLILVASAAGAAFVIKLTQLAGSDVAVSAGLLVLLLLVTIVYMPIVVPLIVPDATVHPASIAWPLILTMLLPLLIGLAVDALIPIWAERLLPILGLTANIALVVLVVSTILTNLRPLLNVFGTGAIFAALLLIGGAFAIGYLLGIPSGGIRDELGLATAQRNIAAAMVVATQTTDNPDTVVMVVVTSVVGLAFLFTAARALRKRADALAADVARLKGTKSPG
jgi:BASS family bile acid:Na+ symporter